MSYGKMPMKNQIMRINENEIPSEILDPNIAVIGYGLLGRPVALCLRDSGHNVKIGLRENSLNIEKALDDDFNVLSIEDSCHKTNAIFLLVPDDIQADVFNEKIVKNIETGSILVLAHGYSFLYEKIRVPKGIDAVVIAPHGPGKALRELFLSGTGLAAQIAIYVDSSGRAKSRALALARSLGHDKSGIGMTSVNDEVIMDHFAEQMVLCGGVVELMRTAFKTLVDAGYDPREAFESVVRELKYTVDLIHEHGPAGLYSRISKSALAGSIINGRQAIGIDAETRMKKVLDMIQSGEFQRGFEELTKGDWNSTAESEIERIEKDFNL